VKWFLVLSVTQTFYTPQQVCPYGTVCQGSDQTIQYSTEEKKIEMPSLDVCQQVARLNKDATCWAQADLGKP